MDDTGHERWERRAARIWVKLPGWAWVVVGVVVVTLVVTLATAPGRAARAKAEHVADVAALVELMTPHEVVYEVEGDGTYFDMTAQTPTGTTQASPDLPLRLDGGGKLTYKFDPGAFVYISAQIRDGRTITCRITPDGVVVSKNTASGEHAIATCDGTA